MGKAAAKAGADKAEEDRAVSRARADKVADRAGVDKVAAARVGVDRVAVRKAEGAGAPVAVQVVAGCRAVVVQEAAVVVEDNRMRRD